MKRTPHSMSFHRSFIHNCLIAFVFIGVLLAGCSTDEGGKQLTAEQRFALGMEKFRDEDYLAAIEEFKVVTLQYQGTAFGDDAQFYMAECRFQREEYILAAYEYDILIRTMPSSEFVSRARFQRATCYYAMSPNSTLDQENTRKAIDEYQAFLEYHPADTLAATAERRIGEMNAKLAEKDFENALIYAKLEYYKAATYYFDLVLEKYHDTPYAEPALLGKAHALFARKRYSEAKDAVEKYLERYPSSASRAEAETLRTEIAEAAASQKNEPARAASSGSPK